MTIYSEMERRRFLEFLGRFGAGAAVAASGWSNEIFANNRAKSTASKINSLVPLRPTSKDALQLAPGFSHSNLISFGDAITPNLKFGECNDYIAFFPIRPGVQFEGVLWVNHEDFNSLFVSNYDGTKKKTREQVDLERSVVGGSVLRVRRGPDGWSVVANDPLNRRFDATTSIPFAGGVQINGRSHATGTLANCAGGTTPWGTVLTCEENYQNFYGETDLSSGDSTKRIFSSNRHGWEEFYPQIPPEDFGWVVEINPMTGAAQKLTGLGRFAHEGATVVVAKDGRPVVYMGDDSENEFIYKFIAAQPGSLVEGELFVADTVKGEWISLSWKNQPTLQKAFANQLEVLIQTRRAARLVGATPQNRPEDIEQDPVTKVMIIALTNNKSKGDVHGSLLKIEEDGNDPLALKFRASTFWTGGKAGEWSCPDNLIFDQRGNLWLTTDISGSSLGKGAHKDFVANGLFYVPMSGDDAGKPIMIAAAPRDAEFTGPCFSPDYRELFLSVQHPGETSKNRANPTSRWPRGGKSLPLSSVVVIGGDLMAEVAST
jgi:secreted PhoX family phosphatase